jgi:hypothetical protein
VGEGRILAGLVVYVVAFTGVFSRRVLYRMNRLLPTMMAAPISVAASGALCHQKKSRATTQKKEE